ncbi:phosphate ABC transporter permease PstA [Abyssicoccus albus]|uniref:Phosphate transport system permease protein PstA n=1 Tax=Abyssicoccus albus TaxID=1817405 RepID=A0A1Q1G156_9BACL|nr:phosphate ABC transporter permease PstA [Abyssicoccus albus]AQL56081.1 phosphate ABC transporter, permease protein PstA [Abyssicoccus albus]RPF58107.1 phosphate ABC transporter membrane protein 2 (PhoT family) [Abyssicoccus albus]
MNYINKDKVNNRMGPRATKNTVMKWVLFACTLVGMVVLAMLLFDVITKGVKFLDGDFLTNFNDTANPENAGVKGALIGSLWLMTTMAPIAIILSVGTAIYMEEYAKDNLVTRFIDVNIANLAGVPSIVFGLLGLTIFVRGAGIEQLSLGVSVLAGALTMALMLLPVIIVSSQESLRAVPNAIKEASIGMGATKWQTITNVILPAAIPGIVTGVILALSRAVGETAPLVVIGVPVGMYFTPTNVMDTFSALPMQLFQWVQLPKAEFQNVTSSGIIILLALLFIMNSAAIYIRNKYSKRY